MIEQIYEPPFDTRRFQKQLDAISKGRNISLRIIWAPRHYVAKTIDRNGSKRRFARYPILFGDFRDYVKGRRYWRKIGKDLVEVAYQKIEDAVIPSNVLLTDISTPDIVHVNPSVHLFIIEKRLADEKAKPIHEEKRRLAWTNLGFDLFGNFPKEGVWDCLLEISEHRDGCCEMAAQYGTRCLGLYREPDERDLQRIRKTIQAWEAMPNVEDKTMLIEQGARDITDAIEKYEDEELTSILQEARECEELDKIAQGRTRVDLASNPPIHRTSY